ncbi:MAG TPA: hypothetical protein VFI15_11780 [Candidatus Limnocylindrales bacterium]|nr:hypothetical protein [Candidatus Limnocylindrales bacterium]
MRTRAVSLAIAFMLALPTVALAETATSDETLTVESTVTMTGLPATIDYGSGPAGTTVTADPITITTSTNSMTGATFRTNGLAFDVGGGFDSFGADARMYHVDGIQADGEFVAYDADEATFQDIDVGTWVSSRDWVVTLAVAIPSTTIPSTVTSQVTFTYEVNPAP